MADLDRLAGEVLLPGTDSYDNLRRPAIARFWDASRPAAIVRCASADDVAGAIAFARAEGLPLAVRSGGHCFAGRSSTSGVLVDVSPMASVSLGDDGVATIGAGARLGDVYDALAPHGVTIPAGCGATVGIAGLVLGGGLGIMGRSHGLTSDSLLAATVVLADGRVVECSAASEPDLFWALRGAGGGRFGAAVSFDFATVEAVDATSIYLAWPGESAAAVIGAWQEWAPDAPDALAASVLVKAGEGHPVSPYIFGSWLGDERTATEQLDQLVKRVRADPSASDLKRLSYRDTKRRLTELGESLEEPLEGGHPYNRSEYFRRSLPLETIEALVSGLAAGDLKGQRRELDFTPWGGAYNRTPASATAFAHRSERFLLKQAVTVDPAIDATTATTWLDRSWSLTHPHGAGGIYPNFPEAALDPWSPAYHGENRHRLLEIKRHYDPESIFGP